MKEGKMRKFAYTQESSKQTFQQLSPLWILEGAGQQAGADITGQLQVRPMLYTLYIGINLTIIMKQYGDRQTDTNI